MPGSFYRLLEVHDTHDAHLSVRFGPATTEPNQSVVYGYVTPRTERDPRLIRRFDHEQVFAPRCTASA